MSEEFSRELCKNGIEREASMPYTPQQNGRADRKSTRLNSSHSGESRMPSSA